ncbi:MAG: hypothetical protein ACREOJ_04815 [Gemmatimonadaceae bacterium]
MTSRIAALVVMLMSPTHSTKPEMATMQRLRRITGLLLYSGSLTAAVLGAARLTFGIAIGLPSGPTLPLGSADPALPFAVSVMLFLFGAALAPPGRRARARFATNRQSSAGLAGQPPAGLDGQPPAGLGAGTPRFDAPVHDAERNATSPTPPPPNPVL